MGLLLLGKRILYRNRFLDDEGRCGDLGAAKELRDPLRALHLENVIAVTSALLATPPRGSR
jgi:hypothetical protein